jgi:hypothetical protein
MSVLYRTDRKRQRPRLTTDAEGRLPRGRALLVIAALSALSWVVLIRTVYGAAGDRIARIATARGLRQRQPLRAGEPTRGRRLRRNRAGIQTRPKSVTHSASQTRDLRVHFP